jgi:hypothetical protein
MIGLRRIFGRKPPTVAEAAAVLSAHAHDNQRARVRAMARHLRQITGQPPHPHLED